MHLLEIDCLTIIETGSLLQFNVEILNSPIGKRGSYKIKLLSELQTNFYKINGFTPGSVFLP